MSRRFESPRDLVGLENVPLGVSEWITMEQSRIDMFANATGDHQWIHVDPVRAKDGPYGVCIAHGYLTLSLASLFLPQIFDLHGFSMGLNYGCEKVRFINVVKVGDRVRGSGLLVKAEEVKGSYQVVIRMTVEIEGSEKPACVVDTIGRYFI